MEFPVRCFTCGTVIGHLYDKYKEKQKDMTKEEALDDIGVHRYCCRRMFISHVEISDTAMKYPRV